MHVVWLFELIEGGNGIIRLTESVLCTRRKPILRDPVKLKNDLRFRLLIENDVSTMTFIRSAAKPITLEINVPRHLYIPMDVAHALCTATESSLWLLAVG